MGDVLTFIVIVVGGVAMFVLIYRWMRSDKI
jgi:hypothetical protein